MHKKENVSTLEIFAAAVIGSLIGGLLAAVYLYRIGGF